MSHRVAHREHRHAVRTLNAQAVDDDHRPSQRHGTWVLMPQAPPAAQTHRTTEQPKGENRPSSCNTTTPPISQESGRQTSQHPRLRWHLQWCRHRRRRWRGKRTHRIRRGEKVQLFELVLVVPHHTPAQRSAGTGRRSLGRGRAETRHQQ